MFDSKTRPRKPGASTGGFRILSNQSKEEKVDKPILMEFPLRGEWLSPNTPGTKVPSHGTNRLGTRYAYDFIQVDWERPGRPSYRGGLLRYLLFGIPVEDYFCWGQPVYAPCGGTVLLAKDGYPENRRTGFFSDLRRAYQSAHSFDPAHDTIQAVAGNFVIIRYAEDVYAALCHLQTGSVRVSAGQSVRAGEIIGKVGHSGNSLSSGQPIIKEILLCRLKPNASSSAPSALPTFPPSTGTPPTRKMPGTCSSA